MSLNITPLQDRVLVLREAKETKTQGGILLAGLTQELPALGKVLAVGKKVEEVSVGDSVAFGQYSGSPLKVDGQEYLILKENDIFAVVAQLVEQGTCNAQVSGSMPADSTTHGKAN